MTDYFTLSLDAHRKTHGKWEMRSKFPVTTQAELSIAYTPGIAAVSQRLSRHPEEAYNLSMKGNSVAIVSDGSAVLGLGDIGPEGALPVMEGKAILLKALAGVDGIPIVINAKEPAEIIQIVKAIAPTFGGINLEDIKAPKCFEIESALQDIGIPVFHDDQHGTAIVLYAALLNACKITGKHFENLKVVINGAGAAGAAVAKLLKGIGQNGDVKPVKDVILCDTKGIISRSRDDLNPSKLQMLEFTNFTNQNGTVFDALKDADVFVGVSAANLLKADDVRVMARDSIIFGLANPIPEIMPAEALAAGAKVVGTGRSDFPNQVNNALAFPGIFRGALDAKASRITEKMKLRAAKALAELITNPTPEKILPHVLDPHVAETIAKAVKDTAIEEGVSRL
ncbi:NAD(P)-dependent malic enzyme [Criblamydia sequanensis]|uniref:NAD-dependent malic enzyme n=1 Tax=Candidatus Criblamydia sequanensis CRIB-18 TaxID=1437425 RepID=A0A090CZ68_9BACT|nr:NADP-dependent malic enzyme [Criblamydia sequanensis]CDR34051.1 NAD-dependent malic enzyme [Criblamydia sequanensis CRIB-18]